MIWNSLICQIIKKFNFDSSILGNCTSFNTRIDALNLFRFFHWDVCHYVEAKEGKWDEEILPKDLSPDNHEKRQPDFPYKVNLLKKSWRGQLHETHLFNILDFSKNHLKSKINMLRLWWNCKITFYQCRSTTLRYFDIRNEISNVLWKAICQDFFMTFIWKLMSKEKIQFKEKMKNSSLKEKKISFTSTFKFYKHKFK